MARILVLIVVLFFLSSSFTFAQIITSTDFKIDRQELLSSGHRVTSSGFIIEGNLGQPIVSGELTSTSFKLGSGILYLPAEAAAAVEEAVEEVAAADPGGGSLIRTLIKKFIAQEIPGFAPSDYDLNNDGYIDLVDLSVFLYLADLPPEENPADLNKDLVINLSDLSILLARWTSAIVEEMNDLLDTSEVESDGALFGQASLLGSVGPVATAQTEESRPTSEIPETTTGGFLDFVFGVIKSIVKFIIGIFGG